MARKFGNYDAAGWANAVNMMMNAGAALSPDQAKQVDLYNQAQTILINDAALLPLRFGLSTYEVQPYVGGINSTPSDAQLPGDLFYETIQIKKH